MSFILHVFYVIYALLIKENDKYYFTTIILQVKQKILVIFDLNQTNPTFIPETPLIEGLGSIFL